MRIVENAQHVLHLPSRLQWSRNFSVADCGWEKRTTPQENYLQWSRNFSVADCRLCWRLSSLHSGTFNGAATFQLRIAINASPFNGASKSLQWSRNFSVADWRAVMTYRSDTLDPSMEPQLFSCGLQICLWIVCSKIYLQWSRNFSVADCRLAHRCHPFFLLPFNGAATFQLRIDGNFFHRPSMGIRPSMEPQLFSCGLCNLST